ncbi:MAG: hypothetical protein AAFW46_08195 [Pseudomonadota bacterium]
MRVLLAAATAVLLAGCQAATTSQTAQSGAASVAPAPLPQPAPSVAATAEAGGSTGMMPAAAKAWIECGLREYYTAPQPITAQAAIGRCETEGRRYVDVYFAEYGFRARFKNQSYLTLSRRAAEDLSAIIREGAA